jgi:hypothetical protein
VNVDKQICFAIVLFCRIAAGQATSAPSYPYLLRLERSNFEGHSCALLQNTGAFHLEVDHGDEVKVFEGTIATNDLFEIEGDLNSEALVDLSQQQIEEPLIPTRRDVLRIAVFRGDRWQYVYFLTSDSQQPFRHWLQPLVYWLDKLHKLPHRELSEDEGKNNCLPRDAIALKKRDAETPPPNSMTANSNTPALSAGTSPHPRPSQPATPISALLRVHLEMRAAETANDSCVLITERGKYRFEERTQKTGKPVNTKILAGQITPEELQQLDHLLDDPALVKIKHHEPPGGMVVRVMGDMLDVSIFRQAGVQQFILSSSFSRPGFPSFYRGDGDSSNARPLLNFLSEHVESNQAGSQDPASRNGCSEAP